MPKIIDKKIKLIAIKKFLSENKPKLIKENLNLKVALPKYINE